MRESLLREFVEPIESRLIWLFEPQEGVIDSRRKDVSEDATGSLRSVAAKPLGCSNSLWIGAAGKPIDSRRLYNGRKL